MNFAYVKYLCNVTQSICKVHITVFTFLPYVEDRILIDCVEALVDGGSSRPFLSGSIPKPKWKWTKIVHLDHAII